MSLAGGVEEELRVALAEGLLGTDEVASLAEESRRTGKRPFDILFESGRLSQETLAKLQIYAGGQETISPGAAGEGREVASPELRLYGDRYTGVRFLGEGGAGRVFHAWDARLQRNVALKVMRDADPDLARRFVAEARAQARVEDDRVCKVYEVGEADGHVYITMQLIDGPTLGRISPSLTLEQKVALIAGVALGVQAAHAAGLIHRDLKPGNILVEVKDDGRLAPYVVDFGLARDFSAPGQTTSTFAGTPHFMSPEQARGEVNRLDRRTDVYSLGATLYTLVLGRPPFDGESALEVITQVAAHDPPRPRALDPDVPLDLEAIILKCLEKERSDRYDSARALAEDLGRFLAGEPVLARAAGRVYRLKKWLRRRWRPVALGSAALLVTLLALGQGVLARRDVERREQAARRFTAQVERIEALARFSELAPLHDTSADRRTIRARMDELRAEIRDAGPEAAGPAEHALARGAYALGDQEEAGRRLESAWALGYREPDVAYALALSWGRRYEARLREVEQIGDRAERESRRRDAEQSFRDPALAYLKQSAGAVVPSEAYVAALLAFYEGRLDDALALAGGADLPWFYEGPRLRGDILLARALARWNDGDREGARADLDAGRRAYVEAAEIGRSVPSVHRALGELELLALNLESYAGGDVDARYAGALAAAARARATQAELYETRVFESRLHRRLAEHRIDRGEPAGDLLAAAAAAAEAARDLAPDRTSARLELAKAYWQSGQDRRGKNEDPREPFGRALTLLDSLAAEESSAALDFQRGVVWKVWGEYADQSGGDPIPNWARAVESFRASLAGDQRQVEAWINLGITLFSRGTHANGLDPDGDLAAARSALARAEAASSENIVVCYYEGQIDEALAARTRRRGGDPRPELERALATYRRCIRWGPELVHLYDGTGSVLLSQAHEVWDRGGDPGPVLEEARAAFRQSITLAPENGIAHHNLAVSFVDAARYARAGGADPRPSVRAAVTALARSAELLAGYSEPWADLGTVHVFAADFELAEGRDPGPSLARAEEAFARAFENNPNDAQAWLYLGEARSLRARGLARRGIVRAAVLDAAEEAYEKALALEPDSDDFAIAFGHFLRTRASVEQNARPTLERALALTEAVLVRRATWPDAQILRGVLLLALAETTGDDVRALARRALADLEPALEANSNLRAPWRKHLDLSNRLSE